MSFYGSKTIFDGCNLLWSVQTTLEGSEINIKHGFKTLWTKKFGSVQSQLNCLKLFWTGRRTRHCIILFLPHLGFLWSNQDKHQFLEIRGNGTEIYYSGSDHDFVKEHEIAPIVRAYQPIPRRGQFHFEVFVENTGQNREIAVGICTKTSPLDQFPGWVPKSFGYHGDDGNIFCESGVDPTFEPEKPFKTGGFVNTVLDYDRSTLTFAGKKKDVQKIQLQSHHMKQDFYPCVGIRSPGAVVRLTTPIGNPIAAPPQPLETKRTGEHDFLVKLQLNKYETAPYFFYQTKT